MIKNRPGKYYILLSLLFWLCMYIFWLWFNSYDMPSTRMNILFTLTDFIFFAGLSLITTNILIPRLLYRKKYLSFFLLYFLLLIVITTAMLEVNFLLLQPYRSAANNANFWSHYTGLSGSYMLSFFLSATTASFKLAADWYRSQQLIVQLSAEKLKAELEFLNMQVNPHSFFNILNTIYFLVDIDREKAKQTIVQFGDMFRYQLYDCNVDKTTLEKELKFIETYIDLQRKRYDEDYSIHFNYEVADKGLRVAPFLFLPLVENAFKHVSGHIDQLNRIDITINASDNQLTCRVINSSNAAAGPGSGLGLANLKRRLALQYNEKHELLTELRDNIYTAVLTIEL